MAVRKCNLAQRAQIVEWLQSTYGNREILKKIDDERRRGILHDDAPWPELTKQTIEEYRQHHGTVRGAQTTAVFSVATGHGLATRDGMLRRVAKQIGDLEHLIDRNTEAIEALYDDGVLDGMPFLPRDDPRIVEADYISDRQATPNGRLPAVSDPIVKIGPAANDPRFIRLKDLYTHQSRLYKSYEGLVRLHAQVSGLISTKTNLDDEAQEVLDVESRRREAETRLRDLFKTAPQPVGASRR